MLKTKTMTAVFIVLILVGIAMLSSCEMIDKLGDELDETKFQFSNNPIKTVNDGDNITLTLFIPCEDVKINVNGEPLDFTFLPYWDKTVINFDLQAITFDELLSLEIQLYNKDDIATDRLIMSDVCFVTDGIVPNGAKTLILLNYKRDEFPEFESDNLASLYIIDLPSAEENRKVKINVKDFNNITSLNALYLNASEIMEGELKYIRALDGLRSITIIDCQKITGDFDVIDDFTILQKLELEGSQIKGDLKDLAEMVSLKQLNLSNNKNISGEIQFLKKISGLETLILEGGKFQGEIMELRDISRLKSLHLSNINTINGNISTITELSKLVSLHIEKMTEVYGDLWTVAEFYNLKSLYIEGNGIEGNLDEIAALSDLHEVMLYSTSEITGDLTSLVFCMNLEKLYLENTSINVNTSRLMLFKKLMDVRLVNTKIAGDIADLAIHSKLRRLTISNENDITGDLSSLDGLDNLFDIYINKCKNIKIGN